MTAVLEAINTTTGQLTSNNNADLPITAASFTALSGAQSGDLLILAVESVVATTAPTLSTPAGWTQLAQLNINASRAIGFAVYYKISAGSESDFTVTSTDGTATNGMAGQIMRFSGIDATDPFNALGTASDNGGSTCPIPSLTTDVEDCQIWYLFGVGRQSGTSVSSSNLRRTMYGAESDPGNAAGGFGFCRLASAIGTYTAPNTTYGGNGIGCIAFALAPSSAPTTTPRITAESVYRCALNSAGVQITPATDGPATIVENQLLIAVVYSASPSAPVIAAPSGWVQVWTASADGGGAITGSVFYKIATNSEPSSYLFTSTGDAGSPVGAKMWTIEDYDKADPIDVFNSNTSTGVSFHSVAAAATTENNTLVMYFNGSGSPGSPNDGSNFAFVPVPALLLVGTGGNQLVGVTDVFSCCSTVGPSGADRCDMHAAMQRQLVAGAPGSRSAGRLTGTVHSQVGGMIAINVGDDPVPPPPEDESGTLEIEVSTTITMDGFGFMPSTVVDTARRLVRGALGCGEYSAYMADRGGGQLNLDIEWSSISITKVVNGTGSCHLNIPAVADSGSPCCEVVAKSEPWRDEVIIYRGNDRVFEGPLKIVGGDESPNCSAEDLFSWFKVRFIENDLHFEADVSDIFRGICEEALAADDSPNINISTRRTGIRAVRDYNGKDLHPAEGLLTELASTGLDFTMVGRRLVAGGLDEFLENPTLLLHDDGVISATPIKDGTNFANDVAILAATLESGGTPVNGRATIGRSVYGLVQKVVTQLLIRDGDSADAQASARAHAFQPVPQRLKVVLSPEAPFEYVDLLPGKRMDVRLSESAGCMEIDQIMRIVQVTTDVEAEERVSVDLIPLGVSE